MIKNKRNSQHNNKFHFDSDFAEDVQQPTLKELLMSRKKGFVLYFFGCFITAIGSLVTYIAMASGVGIFSLKEKNEIIQRIIFISILFLMPAILHIASRFLRIGYMRDILFDVRRFAFRKIFKLSPQKFAQNSKDYYLSNLVNDINIFENNFFISLLNMIYHGGEFFLSLMLLFVIDWRFGFIGLIVSLIVALIGHFFSVRTIQLQTFVSDQSSIFQNKISNIFYGLEILKLNRVEKKFYEQASENISDLEKSKSRFRFYKNMQQEVLWSVGNVVLMLAFLYISFSIATEGQSIETSIIQFLLLNSSIYSIAYFMPHFNSFKSSVNVYNNIVLFTDEQNIEGNSLSDNDLRKKSNFELKQNLEFEFNDTIEVRNLSYTYDQSLPILTDVNFTIERGKKYLLKGISGAGKSTLLNILAGVIPDYNGEILIDNTEMSAIEPSSILSSVAELQQDVFLFEDTLLNNITLYQAKSPNEGTVVVDTSATEDKPDDANRISSKLKNGSVADKKLVQIIEKSGLTALVNKLPDGLNTVLEENGKNLSGGERQRISIARTLYKDSRIILADEPTSGLDPQTGKLIEQTLLSLPQTVIVISHREYPGISEKYDAVLFLSNGAVKMLKSEEVQNA